jgi:hypothetical protein
MKGVFFGGAGRAARQIDIFDLSTNAIRSAGVLQHGDAS